MPVVNPIHDASLSKNICPINGRLSSTAKISVERVFKILPAGLIS